MIAFICERLRRARSRRAIKKLRSRIERPDLSAASRESAANELWESPVFKQAVKDVVADLTNGMLHTASREQLIELHRDTRALYRVTEKLNSYYQPQETEQ